MKELIDLGNPITVKGDKAEQMLGVIYNILKKDIQDGSDITFHAQTTKEGHEITYHITSKIPNL